MSKFASFAEYPARSLVGAEAALLTAWVSLERYHESLVLVGGLAVKYLIQPGSNSQPGAITMDVDLGVALAVEGGQYGSIADDLAGQGFKRDEQGRYVRQFEAMPVFIDFLTEHPTAREGTALVDGVPAGVFPGIGRALATKREVSIEGDDLFGVRQRVQVPVSGIGPLLVLKLNAFAGRQQPKDAYDVLLLVTRYVDGFDAAVAEFRVEATAANPGYARAAATLRQHFTEAEQSGPVRCAAFAFGDQPPGAEGRDRQRQIIQQMVTVGRTLLGE